MADLKPRQTFALIAFIASVSALPLLRATLEYSSVAKIGVTFGEVLRKLLETDFWTQFCVVLIFLALFNALVTYATSGEIGIRPFLSKLGFAYMGSTMKLGQPEVPRRREDNQESIENATSAEGWLRVAADSAKRLATRMERRTNTYLILGIGIGFLGLAVWAWVNRTSSIDSQPLSWQKLGLIAVFIIPKLTILVFIEVLAGFFLRQYRIGVEDFKYFLNLSNIANGRRVSYLILLSMGQDGKEALRNFAVNLAVFASETADTKASPVQSDANENPMTEIMKIFGDKAVEAGKQGVEMIKAARAK